MEKRPFKTLSVVGAGFMGARISLHCASFGYTVWLVDISQAALNRASRTYDRELNALVNKKEISLSRKNAFLRRIHLTTNLETGASLADLVIEAVPERLEIKREVFAKLDQTCPGKTILATNSSAIPVSSIEDATRRPDRVLNTHFYGDIRGIPMVELMCGTATSDQTIECISRFVRSINLTPLLAKRESTGFIFNRVWHVIKKECLHILNDGIASHEDVDRAWMMFTGLPIGPFGLMDIVGLDTVRDIELVYYRESGNEPDSPPKVLLDKIDKGELGVKTGKGFYTYPNPVFEDPSWLKGDK